MGAGELERALLPCKERMSGKGSSSGRSHSRQRVSHLEAQHEQDTAPVTVPKHRAFTMLEWE